ncbi:MAG: hypothetical protein KIG39_05570 [Lachnospiraceae bacterium]|nr:hypothetical protein [Lachnospiraceae bacterium]
MKRRANMSFAVFVALLVICCGAALINISISSKYNSKTEYQRMKNRYIAECGIDTAVGLFVNYLDNRDLEVSYTKNEDGSFSASSVSSPYILDEIRTATEDTVSIDIVSDEARNYLISLGYLEYSKSGEVELKVNTFSQPDKFKISELCIEPDFLISSDIETEEQRSMLNPIYLTITSTYNNGNVLCNVKLSELYAVRTPYPDIEVGEMGSVSAYIDTKDIKIEYESYQNYGGAAG